MSDNRGFFSLPEENRFELILAVILLLGVITCIAFISLGDLTNNESGILSLFLTVLSIIASWLFAKLYGDSQHAKAIEEVKEMHNENLRTYALKAAEKVTNLSHQLNQLSNYIQSELDNDDYDTDTEELQAKEERLLSSIHMIGMLKSVNDTSLSDWQGVIGEEIEEQREEQEEREEALKELVYRAERLVSESDGSNIDSLNNEVNDLRKSINVLSRDLAGTFIRGKINKKKPKREVISNCTNCDTSVNYIQRTEINSVKVMPCPECKKKLVSRFNPQTDDFYVELGEPKLEKISCPAAACEATIDVMLRNIPNVKTSLTCDDCGHPISVKRNLLGGIEVSGQDMRHLATVIDSKFIEEVDKLLPEQPWPKEIHKSVASELECSNASVQKAIKKLINSGIYKQQVDGILYEKSTTSN